MAFNEFVQWQAHDGSGRRKYVSAAERARFLHEANRLSLPLQALCRVLAFTGCRVSEALALTRAQLDADQQTLTFKTLKRRRVVFRVVPIPADLVRLLAQLPQAADGRLWPMHRSTAWRLIKRCMVAAEIDGPMACCKGLRHGFGVRAAGASIPINVIGKWMGHASTITTAIYLDVVGAEERAFAERLWRGG